MAEYYYLASSLPMLMPDLDPVMSLEDFEEQCSDWLSPEELAVINDLGLVPGGGHAPGSAGARWNDWETCLRNRLARGRSGSGQELENILREESDCYGEIELGVAETLASTDPMEREKMLDALRWRFLDDLETGHTFDFDALCVYKLKLLLRLKWTGRAVNTGRENLAKTIDTIEAGQDNVAAPENSL